MADEVRGLLQGIRASRKYSNRRHNNRKMTSGRKERRHSLGGRRGYVPNRVIHNYKMLEIYVNSLERLEARPIVEQVKLMNKISHFKALIRQQEIKIKEHNAEF